LGGGGGEAREGERGRKGGKVETHRNILCIILIFAATAIVLE